MPPSAAVSNFLASNVSCRGRDVAYRTPLRQGGVVTRRYELARRGRHTKRRGTAGEGREEEKEDEAAASPSRPAANNHYGG